MVETAAESEPKLGSVMAIDAHTSAKRSSCSLSATAAIAALPRPLWDRQGQADVAPAGLERVEHRDHVDAVLGRPLVGLAGGLGALLLGFLDEFAQVIELGGVFVLGLVVLTGHGPEDVLAHRVGLLHGRSQLRGELKVDRHGRHLTAE